VSFYVVTFICVTVIALHYFNCIHARLLRDFNKVSVSVYLYFFLTDRRAEPRQTLRFSSVVVSSIMGGALFSSKKVDDFSLVITLKRRSKTLNEPLKPLNLPRLAMS